MDTENTLSPEQMWVFRLLEETDKSLFLTGKAGTGKSHLIRYLLKHSTKNIALLSYTGLAAANIGGQTINSFFQIFSHGIYDPQEQIAILEDRDSAYGLKRMLNKLDLLVIDEISMVRSDLFHTINEICKLYRDNPQPFGGLQLLLVGDPYQLPPVVKPAEIKPILMKRYGGVHFFNAPDVTSYVGAYQLKQIFRQDDEQFKHILNNIREGTNLPQVLSLLNTRVGIPKSMQNVVVVATRNDMVDNYNEKELAKLSTPTYTYKAIIKGSFKDRPTNEELVLKEGAQIMMLKNDMMGRWYNGSIGVITELTKDSIKVEINGNEYDVEKFTWTNNKYNYDEDTDTLDQTYLGSFTQYPIRLAWAVTVHKSQGQTYESAFINIPQAFESGQTYVALSRCKSLDKLYLARPIKEKDVLVDPAIRQFMSNIK